MFRYLDLTIYTSIEEAEKENGVIFPDLYGEVAWVAEASITVSPHDMEIDLDRAIHHKMVRNHRVMITPNPIAYDDGRVYSGHVNWVVGLK